MKTYLMKNCKQWEQNILQGEIRVTTQAVTMLHLERDCESYVLETR